MNYSTQVSNPTAHITRKKSRLKVYGEGKIFLKDGDTFEFDLHNPTTSEVLVKIKINGNYISDNGIIVKPGQRVFLERFLDSNNKFVFNTYMIDPNTENWSAIKLNGDIVVEFYSEKLYNDYSGIGTTNPWIISGSGSINLPLNSVTFGGNLSTNTTNVKYNSMYFSNTTSYTTNINPVETGRIEKGEQSEQTFNTSFNTFNTTPFHTVKYKILPHGNMNAEIGDIVNYCPECGKKQKKQNNFCPSCGTKL